MPQTSEFAAQAAALPDVQNFPGLAYGAFAYAGDEDALRHLRQMPGVPQLFEWIYKHVVDDYWRLFLSSNCIRCDGEKNYPTLYRLLQRSCKVLDVPEPHLYVGYSPFYNASTSGSTQPFILLHSKLVEEFSPVEVAAVIGHELGHIKGKHVIYSSTAEFIIRFLPLLQSLIPVNVGIIQLPLLLAMHEWIRRYEFSCDRAGLLAIQDLPGALGSSSKFCGAVANLPEEFDPEHAAMQHFEWEDSDNAVAKVLLMLQGMWATHPASVERLHRLRQFAHSDKYRRILAGEYERERQKAAGSSSG